MEIRAQAFAFSTNDEVNNMSFYNYVLINQGTQTLTNTYMAQWVDVDLGAHGRLRGGGCASRPRIRLQRTNSMNPPAIPWLRQKPSCHG